MIDIFKTRLILLKKQWPSLLFWLLLPIGATVIIISITNSIQADTKVPVGIVLEEETALAMGVYDSIKQTPFIRVHETTEKDALYKLKKHELDSVFIIHDGYEEQIRQGSRNRLITSYQSDLSFAYTPVKEMIVSYAQQETGRSKAAHTVLMLSEQYNQSKQWTWEEIINKSKSIQKEENLLHTQFSFANTDQIAADNEFTIWNTWGLWAVFSILSTFLLFDWLIRESNANILPRFAFIRFSFKNYILKIFLLYTMLYLLFDMIAISVFHTFLNEPISLSFIGAIISFRLIVNAGVFLFARCFKNVFLFYSVSFVVTLFLAITSGAILPIDGIVTKYKWIEYLHPLHPFLSGEISYVWLIIFSLLITIWYIGKEQSSA